MSATNAFEWRYDNAEKIFYHHKVKVKNPAKAVKRCLFRSTAHRKAKVAH